MELLKDAMEMTFSRASERLKKREDEDYDEQVEEELEEEVRISLYTLMNVWIWSGYLIWILFSILLDMIRISLYTGLDIVLHTIEQSGYLCIL